MFRAITFAALVAYASAQSISTNCSTTLANIVKNTDAATCLSAGSLVTILGGSPASLVGPINTWLTNLCNAPACSNDTIAAVVQNITTGCASDLAPSGFTPSLTPSITNLAQQYYPALRQVVCLKDGNTNCITQTLSNIETITGPLNLTTIASMTTTVPDFANIPANITCTNCIKAIYSDVNKAIPSLISDTAPALQSKCGASFTDGQIPSGIVESATTATSLPSSNSATLGGVSPFSHGVITGLSLSGLVVISTFFTLLA